MPKTPTEIAVEEGQKCLKASPVIVLGSGASIPFGLPSMGKLADHLKGSMQAGALSGTDKGLWDQFIDELATKDLESALQAIKLSDRLSDHVVEHTWNLIGTADAQVFQEAISNGNYLPLTRLYRHLSSLKFEHVGYASHWYAWILKRVGCAVPGNQTVARPAT